MTSDTVVLYTTPLRSHVVPIVELGKLITQFHPHVSVTVIIIPSPHPSLSTDSYISALSASYPSINFIILPALPPPPPSTASPSFRDIVSSSFQLAKSNNPNFHDALSNISKSTSIKAVVLDLFCNYAVEVCSSLSIPTYFFRPSSATALCYLLYWPTIHINFKDLTPTVDVPGTPTLPSKDVPAVMLDRSHQVYQSFLDTSKQMANSAGIIINTFELLEPRAVKAIVEGKCTPDGPDPPIYCIGPVVSSSECEEYECLTWLGSQPTRSVVFLAFGSMGVFPLAQLQEMAFGIEKSGVRFLWVVRNPSADGENNATSTISPSDEPKLETLLPEGFLNRTKDRGLVLKSWAPQVAVLNHESVGGFVNYCGWNSILEAICAGVPMIAWPFFAEHKLHRAFLVEEMKLALPLRESENGMVKANELEERLVELMKSETGEEIRKRVGEMKEAGAVALSDGGPSRAALGRLVKSFNVVPTPI